MTPRVRRLALLLVAGAVAAPAAQEAGPGSVERVRAGLEKPPSKLTLTVRVPDFTVEIHERRPMQEIFETPPWATPRPGWSPPGGFGTTAFGSIPIASVDLLSLGGFIARKVNDVRRARATRDASEEVAVAIAGYCAGQPNAGAGIQICTTSPAIR